MCVCERIKIPHAVDKINRFLSVSRVVKMIRILSSFLLNIYGVRLFIRPSRRRLVRYAFRIVYS